MRKPPRPGRGASLAVVAAVYVLALAAAWATFHGVGGHPLANGLAGLLAATAVTYAASLWAQNGSVFDPYWSVLPPAVALYWAQAGAPDGRRAAALLAVVGLWAVRLTAHWARGWPGLHHEDWRYAKLYRDWPLPRWATLLLGVELAPTAIIALGCLPMYAALARPGAPFGALDAAALVVGLGATALELAADAQMRAFGRTSRPGEVMRSGLWRWSRHPNYFGEVCFWVSLWLFALAADPRAWWAALGPAAIVLMFHFASIPMLDERSRERRPGFDDYARGTRALLPLPRRRARGAHGAGGSE